MLARFFRPDSCSKRLSQLEDRIETHERRLRALDADFTDLWDRVQRQVQRITKREERERAGVSPGTGAAPVDDVSARIIARRMLSVRKVVPTG